MNILQDPGRVENGMVVGLGAALDERYGSTELEFLALRDELIDALLQDPARIVSTPGFERTKPMTAAEVVEDSFDYPGGGASLHELLRIVGAVAAGRLSSAEANRLHLRASAWIATAGVVHAEYHAGSEL